MINVHGAKEYTFEKLPNFLKVKNIIENSQNEIFTCAVTCAEVISKFIRRGLDKEIAVNAMGSMSKIIKVDLELGEKTAVIHAKVKKNIKDFLGKPLISWTIDTALKSGVMDRYIVDTDSEEIAEVASLIYAEEIKKELEAEISNINKQEEIEDITGFSDE